MGGGTIFLVGKCKEISGLAYSALRLTQMKTDKKVQINTDKNRAVADFIIWHGDKDLASFDTVISEIENRIF